MKEGKGHQDYWLRDVYFTGGKGFGIELVEIEPIGSRRRWEAETICLGRGRGQVAAPGLLQAGQVW